MAKTKKESSHTFSKCFLKNKVLFTVIAVILGLLFLDIGVVVGTHFKWNAWGTLFFSLALLAIIALVYYGQLKKANELLPRRVYSNEEIKEANSLVLVIHEGRMDADAAKRAERVMKVISMIITYAFLIIMAFAIIIPFYWMLITSLKTNSEIRDQITFFPQTIQWANYKILFQGLKAGAEFEGSQVVSRTDPFNFLTYMKNTLIVGVLSTLGTLITTILAAFAFSRLNFKGKDLVFTIFLATMMIPGEMMVITNYITVSSWLDSDVGTYAAMIIPFWVSTYYIYLLRQNFKQIPNELYYAAKVDGKSDWSYLWKVMVPLAMPTLITVFILKLMGAWNSYVWPNLVADKESMRLVANGLRGYGASPDGQPHQGLQMAATVVVTVPLLLLFIFFRKYIMRGVGRAGIKG